MARMMYLQEVLSAIDGVWIAIHVAACVCAGESWEVSTSQTENNAAVAFLALDSMGDVVLCGGAGVGGRRWRDGGERGV